MAKKINFVVKVMDAKLLDIKKALEAKNIKLESIIEIYKEEIADPSANAKSVEPAKTSGAVPPKPPAPAAAVTTPSQKTFPASPPAASSPLLKISGSPETPASSPKGEANPKSETPQP